MEAIDTSQVMKIVSKDPHLFMRATLEANLKMYRKLAAMDDAELFLACCLLRLPFPPPPFSEIKHLRDSFNNSIPFIERELQRTYEIPD